MEVEIEKNAELPDRVGEWGKWQKLVKEMDVGDAVTFLDDKNMTAYHGIRRAAKGLGFKITMRTIEGGKIKVWKQETIEDSE
jgi:hypothetical protein|tara:strand:- start:2255 stop:2500 length:246 start_codon:yes stop_codon:yes gene_type:complete